MKLYRFSPIKNEAELLQAIEYLHTACNKLVFQAFGRYLPVRQCIGIFTHYDEEYELLTEIRKRLTNPNITYKGKYFKLLEPITISEKDSVPAATYEFLYIRKVDPYRSQVGDIDFVLPVEEHEQMKRTLHTDTFVNYARLFGRTEENMVELWNPDVDVIPYVAAEYMQETIDRENLSSS